MIIALTWGTKWLEASLHAVAWCAYLPPTSGTVKENLDPYGFCTDRQLLEALKKAKLDK
jgi:hypothetical protein